MKLTPEIETIEEYIYLIKVDGEELVFVQSDEEAIAAIDSIAAEEARRFSSDSVKITREDLKEGRHVKLYRQQLGYVYNSKIDVCMDVTMVRVNRCAVVHTRISTEPKSEVSEAPSDGEVQNAEQPEKEESSPPLPPPLPPAREE